MRRMTAAVIVAFALLAGCMPAPDTGPSGDTCEDEQYLKDNYRECIGEDAYNSHRDEAADTVKAYRDAHRDPTADDALLRCNGEMPVHACTEDAGPHCEWTAHRIGEPGSMYVVTCKCLSGSALEMHRESRCGI